MVRGKRIFLRDGSEVLIRPIEPADRDLITDGFSRLSLQSRWYRFLTGKPELSAQELRYFTEVDHHDHEALAALDYLDGRGLGVARYIRHVDDSAVAEVAVAVIDDWQGRGLGTELLTQLTDRAREEGIRRFTALVAADNAAVLGLLRDTGAVFRVTHRDRSTVEYELTLAPVGLGGELHALLRAFGRRQIRAPTPIPDILAALIPDRLAHDDE